MRTEKAQISVCIRAVSSGPFLFANRFIGYCRMYEWRAKARVLLCARTISNCASCACCKLPFRLTRQNFGYNTWAASSEKVPSSTRKMFNSHHPAHAQGLILAFALYVYLMGFHTVWSKLLLSAHARVSFVNNCSRNSSWTPQMPFAATLEVLITSASDDI